MTASLEPLQVHWQLQAVMKQRGVTSIAALRRKLDGHYPFISEVQLGRIVKQLPERMNMPLLAALCHALDCEPNDLLYWGTSPPPTSFSGTQRKAMPASSPSQETIERLRGPAFRVFSRPKEDGLS